MIDEHKNWIGTRRELILLIKTYEKLFPKKYRMFSKQIGKYTSVNDRRIQQFINLGILPNPTFEQKKYLYNFVHLIRYLSAIILRNKGYPLKIIHENLDIKNIDQIKEEFIDDSKISTSYENKKSEELDFKFRLRKLGRKEGKVLEINQKKLAITPWCSVLINEDKISSLSEKDIDTLVEAFSNSLGSIINK